MGILNWFTSKTLYYPGCLTKFLGEDEKYRAIFNKLGIDFILLPGEVCCGLPALNAGYKKDIRKLAQKNLELFKKNNIKKIITSCPSCYHIFKDVYSEILPEWSGSGIKVEHATIAILNSLKKKSIDFSDMPDEEKEPVTYHDPCHLGRYSGIYEEPREVIKRLGGKIIEIKYNRENAFCCGAGGGMRVNFPKIAKAISEKKAIYIPKVAEKIISPCMLCWINLKSATDKSEEFSSFVLRKLEALK